VIVSPKKRPDASTRPPLRIIVRSLKVIELWHGQMWGDVGSCRER